MTKGALPVGSAPSKAKDKEAENGIYGSRDERDL